MFLVNLELFPLVHWECFFQLFDATVLDDKSRPFANGLWLLERFDLVLWDGC